MFLVYNGVVLSCERTAEYTMEPVWSSDGVDLLYHRITIGAWFTWNPFTQQVPGGPPIPNIANGGLADAANPVFPDPALNNTNRLGLIITQLKPLLMTPRATLQFFNGTDVLTVVPEVAQWQFQGGKPYPAACDANFGPIPQSCRVQEVQGTKNALVYYRIIAHTTQCKNVILSNRWSIHASTDADGFSTRVIQGRTVVRADVIATGQISADAFRQNLLVPPPYTFQRMAVQVNVNS